MPMRRTCSSVPADARPRPCRRRPGARLAPVAARHRRPVGSARRPGSRRASAGAATQQRRPHAHGARGPPRSGTGGRPHAGERRSDPLDDRAGAEAAAAAHATRGRSGRRCARARGAPWSAGRRRCRRAGGRGRWRRRWGSSCSRSAPTSFAQASTTEAKASLISNTSMSSIDRPVRVEQLLGGVDRAGEHQDGVDADEAGVDDPGPGREAELLGLLGGHEQHGGGAVGDLRGRAGGVHAVLAGDRLEGGELLERGLAQALVAGDRVGGAGGLAVARRRRARRSGRSGCRSDPRPRRGRRAAGSARPKASVSARVMPHFSAMRSAPSNWEVNSYCAK